MEEKHQGMDRSVDVVFAAHRVWQRSMGSNRSRCICRNTPTTLGRHVAGISQLGSTDFGKIYNVGKGDSRAVFSLVYWKCVLLDPEIGIQIDPQSPAHQINGWFRIVVAVAVKSYIRVDAWACINAGYGLITLFACQCEYYATNLDLKSTGKREKENIGIEKHKTLWSRRTRKEAGCDWGQLEILAEDQNAWGNHIGSQCPVSAVAASIWFDWYAPIVVWDTTVHVRAQWNWMSKTAYFLWRDLSNVKSTMSFAIIVVLFTRMLLTVTNHVASGGSYPQKIRVVQNV